MYLQDDGSLHKLPQTNFSECMFIYLLICLIGLVEYSICFLYYSGFESGRSLFEGVCVNYRHPDPRRVWKGGSELQSMTPDPGIPRLPRMNSRSAEFDDFYNARGLARRSRAMFF